MEAVTRDVLVVVEGDLGEQVLALPPEGADGLEGGAVLVAEVGQPLVAAVDGDGDGVGGRPFAGPGGGGTGAGAALTRPETCRVQTASGSPAGRE